MPREHSGTDTPPPAPEFRNNAVLNLAVSECFELDGHVAWKTMRKRPGSPREGHSMTTWLPENCVPVRFSLLKDGKTVVEIDNRVFYASPMLTVNPKCPRGVVFIGNYTEDKVQHKNVLGNVGYRIEPRVLVYDIMYVDRKTQPPVDSRYETLRTLFAPHFKHTVATVQWVGDSSAAETLLQRDPGFGHKISSLIYLSDIPGDVIKPISISIPDFHMKRSRHA